MNAATAAAAADTARITLDQSACIRSQSNIGETITHNICTGAQAVVPWGSADWLGFWLLAGIGGAVMLIIGVLLVAVIGSLIRGY